MPAQESACIAGLAVPAITSAVDGVPQLTSVAFLTLLMFTIRGLPLRLPVCLSPLPRVGICGQMLGRFMVALIMELIPTRQTKYVTATELRAEAELFTPAAAAGCAQAPWPMHIQRFSSTPTP